MVLLAIVKLVLVFGIVVWLVSALLPFTPFKVVLLCMGEVFGQI